MLRFKKKLPDHFKQQPHYTYIARNAVADVQGEEGEAATGLEKKMEDIKIGKQPFFDE